MTARGNARNAIVLDDADRELFLGCLADVITRCGWICHAYCLMEDHYHLLLETPEGNLSRGMRQVNGVFTQRVNRRHGRVWHLFQGRFKAIVVVESVRKFGTSQSVEAHPRLRGFHS